MAEVRLEGVVKRYRGLHRDALAETTVTFKDGLFTCVLGPSGSGKSTLLKLLAGIEEATSGRIFFDETDVTHITPERRDVAMVFQSYALYPNMTARDNIAFPLRLRGMSRSERYRRVDDVAEMLGISATLDRHPARLSGGERQRVALGRAIVRDPKVFLLDEPISNLDANLRIQTREELKRIHAELKATFIYVTHDQDDASVMGDEVIVMAGGRIHQVAPPAVVYRQPADRFVASFLGRLPMNLLTASLSDESGRLILRDREGMRLDLGPLAAGHTLPDGEVIVGIRPESVAAVRSDDASDGIEARVTLTEVVPPDRYVTASLEGWTVRARAADDEELHPGEHVRLRFSLGHMLFFDVRTEQRLVAPAPSREARTADG